MKSYAKKNVLENVFQGCKISNKNTKFVFAQFVAKSLSHPIDGSTAPTGHVQHCSSVAVFYPVFALLLSNH